MRGKEHKEQRSQREQNAMNTNGDIEKERKSERAKEQKATAVSKLPNSNFSRIVQVTLDTDHDLDASGYVNSFCLTLFSY